MSNGFEHQPVGLRAPRVPFDLRCVILAAMGLLVMMGADWVLGKVLHTATPVCDTLMMAVGLLGGLGVVPATAKIPSLEWYEVIVTALVFFVIWAYFGGAMLRASALRLTRDEPLSLGEALRFGGRNWLTYLTAPLIVALFAGFFILCNMAVGLILSLWGIGSSLLVFLLFPLVLISSLLITLAILGGLILLPLTWAGISVEQNGALEAVSRTFSYLFARPFRFFFGYLLLAVMAGVILFVAGHYEVTLKQSLKGGIVRGAMDDAISREPRSVGEPLKNPYLNAPKTVRQREGISDIRNIGDARWYDKAGFFWMWLLLGAFMLGFKGYAIYILMGGTVSLYLQLRRDVDGADETEIYPPNDEGDLADGTQPKWAEEPAQAAETTDTETNKEGDSDETTEGASS